MRALKNQPDLDVSCILTRRDIKTLSSAEPYTNSIDEFIEKSQLVVECAGDPINGTDIIARALAASRPVVTMNAELHVTAGTYLSTLGYLTEAEGDQPGALAALHREALSMGFKPLVYGNLKGYLNHYPSLEDMKYWAKFQGISLDQVTAFTDGTKLQLEQVLVANGLGATIACQGLLGYKAAEVDEGSYRLAEDAKKIGHPISDYLLSQPGAPRKLPAGVFITGEHDPLQAAALKYLKLGEGPFYTLLRNYHLCHLEIPKTIREVITGGVVLLDNGSKPTTSVAAIAKTELKAGQQVRQALGSFEVRGEAIHIKSIPDHLPIGLMRNAVIKHTIEPGQMLSMADVELPETLALKAWQYTLQQAL
jgi:predicted homoserine dehydrogenase-like protein